MREGRKLGAGRDGDVLVKGNMNDNMNRKMKLLVVASLQVRFMERVGYQSY